MQNRDNQSQNRSQNEREQNQQNNSQSERSQKENRKSALHLNTGQRDICAFDQSSAPFPENSAAS